jgi:glucosyl-dolichyl phosphate glucuronosyltransferase
MHMDISVVVCTYKRPNLLRNTLEALVQQQAPSDIRWELIIVDNNSRDQTREVVSEKAAQSKIPVRYYFEPQQGQCHARNAGILASRGDIVAFTDDDVLPENNWVMNIFAIMKSYDLDGVGGRILPKWEAKVPPWLQSRTHLWGYLALIESVELRALTLPLADGAKIWGANMAFRRSLFEEIGAFDVRRGNVGNKFYRGDETEFVKRALGAGKRLIYDPRAVVYHRVGPERMRKAYFRKVQFDGGEIQALQPGLPPGARLFGAPRWLYRIVATEGYEWLWRAILVREDAFDRELDLLDDVGRLWGFWKQWLSASKAAVSDEHPVAK